MNYQFIHTACYQSDMDVKGTKTCMNVPIMHVQDDNMNLQFEKPIVIPRTST